MRWYIFTICYLFLFNFIYAQDKIIIMPFSVHEGDTFFTSVIPEVKILDFKDNNERRAYFILKRKVLKVYPYAIAVLINLKREEMLRVVEESLENKKVVVQLE